MYYGFIILCRTIGPTILYDKTIINTQLLHLQNPLGHERLFDGKQLSQGNAHFYTNQTCFPA